MIENVGGVSRIRCKRPVWMYQLFALYHINVIRTRLRVSPDQQTQDYLRREWDLLPTCRRQRRLLQALDRPRQIETGNLHDFRPAASTTCVTSIACSLREQRIHLLDRVRIPAQHTWRSARSQRRTLEFTLRFGQIRIGYSEAKYKHDNESNSGVQRWVCKHVMCFMRCNNPAKNCSRCKPAAQ
jgi:hypothetical protein